MANTIDPGSESSRGQKSAPDAAAQQEAQTAATLAPAEEPPHSAQQKNNRGGASRGWRKPLFLALLAAALAFGGYRLAPAVRTALNTVSTDDAYVDGHVTFVAPRVSGQVTRVLVDDNVRVKQGSVLVTLDREPYEIQLAVRQAAVTAAKADLIAAQAQVRASVGQLRAARYALARAVEDVNSKIADLKAHVATLASKKASLELARANLKRGEQLLPSGGISKEDLDSRRQRAKVDEAGVDQALQAVYASRVGLGLDAEPPKGQGLGDTPPKLVEEFSAVRTSLGQLIAAAAQIGYAPHLWNASPQETLDEFLKQDPQGNVQHILDKMIPEAPATKQAQARLLEANEALRKAELDLRYCDVVSEIDGMVTRRNVNPGNNVQAGQSLMAVRSLTEIWIDANFKETQLADLRIGQRVRCEVDMYGSHLDFEGRITGFTMGTGQTLSLLPPQNATGNFVKIVQRLPVRIDLSDYDPEKVPLFAGLSVVPYVYYKEPPSGPSAGEFLQPIMALPEGPSVSGRGPGLPAAPAGKKPAKSPTEG
jgi:membrane fusion protein, multidrug efflux system